MKTETEGFSVRREKHGVTDKQRQQAIERSRRHSFREVTNATGLPFGTVTGQSATQSTTTGHQPTTLFIDGELI